MDNITYIVAWSLYIVAALLLSWLGWRVFKRFLLRELAYLLECWMLAFLLTPWFVLPDQNVLGPAWMIFILDAVTIDVQTAIRALIPVTAVMLLGLLLAVVLGVVYRVRWFRSRQ
jgi:ABC-type iron transport system FetAB permease component